MSIFSPVNQEENNFIKVPISHFQSRTRGIKNLLSILVDKDMELRNLKAKYQKIESQHEKFLSEKFNSLSLSDICHSLSNPHLQRENSSGTMQVGISEGTFYDVLRQLCEAKFQINQLKKTVNLPLRIDSWTQTEDSTRLASLVDNNCELIKKNQELENQVEIQKKEIESMKLKLQEEKKEKRTAIEEAKKANARLKREKELHKQTLQKFQDKTETPHLVRHPLQRCSSPALNLIAFNDLEVDGVVEASPSSEPCCKCQKLFATNDELEDHSKICDVERSQTEEPDDNLSEK